MWPFTRRPDPRDEALKSIAQMAIAGARAAAEQAKVLQEYLKLFKTDGPPEGHVIREEDEYRAELEREASKLPAGPARDQMLYILQSMDEGE